MEARKWRKLLQREGPYWFWGLLGKRFRFAYNEHCGKHPKQFKFKSFCPQCYSTFWVSKRWSSFDFSQILGASSTRTIVKSSVLLWLHTLVLARGTWYMEWVTIPLIIKTVNTIQFCLWKIWPYEHDQQKLPLFGVRYKGEENLLKKMKRNLSSCFRC
jgi:hypothetical protein